MPTTHSSRRMFRRRAVQLEVSITLRPPKAIQKSTVDSGLTLVGRSRDISETGIALIVSANNIDRYFKQKDSTFLIQIKLPTARLQFKAVPVYFKKFAAGGVVNYLIGSCFTDADPNQLSQLKRFLHSLPPI